MESTCKSLHRPDRAFRLGCPGIRLRARPIFSVAQVRLRTCEAPYFGLGACVGGKCQRKERWQLRPVGTRIPDKCAVKPRMTLLNYSRLATNQASHA